MSYENRKKLVSKYKNVHGECDPDSCKCIYGVEIASDSFKSYLVCFAATLCNTVLMGYSCSFGVLFPPLLDHFKQDSATTAWVGSLYLSISTLLGPVAANLCDRYGCRLTAFFGGLTCVLGLLLTSQAPSIFCMYLTYSVIVGFGTCCVYTASFVVVPRYFIKRRAQATGIVSCGTSVGSLVMAPLLQLFLDSIGWRNTFIAMAGIASVTCLIALIYDSRTANQISANEEEVHFEAQTMVIAKKQSAWFEDILKNRDLVTWTVCCGVLFLGLYNPQVLLITYAEERGIPADKSAMFFCYMGLASTMSRICVSRICDSKCINAQIIIQGALLSISAATGLLPFASAYYHIMVYALVFGFCDGCFGGCIYFQVIGCVQSHFTSKAFGFWMGVTSPSLAAGPPIAGYVADKMKSYGPAFYVSAAFVFVAAVIPCVLCCSYGRKNTTVNQVKVSSEEHHIERETAL